MSSEYFFPGLLVVFKAEYTTVFELNRGFFRHLPVLFAHSS